MDVTHGDPFNIKNIKLEGHKTFYRTRFDSIKSGDHHNESIHRRCKIIDEADDIKSLGFGSSQYSSKIGVPRLTGSQKTKIMQMPNDYKFLMLKTQNTFKHLASSHLSGSSYRLTRNGRPIKNSNMNSTLQSSI